MNSKYYENPNKKAFKEIKTIANTITGTGSMIFTASKEDEAAIEDPEFKNGLFTHYLLEEFQKERKEERIAIVEIFTPVAEQVAIRAKTNYHHVQTPTLKSYLEGSVYVPVFKKRVKVTPRVIEIPRYPQLAAAVFSAPEIQLDDKKQKQILNETIGFVIQSRQTEAFPIREIVYERFCIKLVSDLKKEWEKIFAANGGEVANIPGSVAYLEAASFQIFVLGAVIAVFGSERQVKIYAENIVEFLGLAKSRSGLIALIL